MKLSVMCLRSYSTFREVLPAETIRSRFLDYFIKDNEHQFVKSSSVYPLFDYSTPFTHAGMCQFKRVFLGQEEIDCSKAANSQKCIRIEGKYDLMDRIGFDRHHHTFFEMLGNWSFGLYSKKEACNLAWNLLTSSPYCLSPHKLFVTYFGGDVKLSLPADDDVREIWLEIGVHPERIIPFSAKENFWEMNITGPCGTCTEIHVALTEDACYRPDLVNCSNSIIELWNIVFLKYNKIDGMLKLLSKEFIDAGMGFERLVSVLQQKNSSYETDLFQPLFSAVEKYTGAPKYSGTFNVANLDPLYRRLADFSRMFTVAVTNNIFPDLNSRLRRVLRKAIFIAQNDFKQSSPECLLFELSKRVSESLCEVFPEIGNNLNQVNLIVENEVELIKEMIKTQRDWWDKAKAQYPVLQSYNFVENPELPKAYKYLLIQLDKLKIRDTIPADKVHILSNTFLLEHSVIQELASSLNLSINWDEYELYLRQIENRSINNIRRIADYEIILESLDIKTDDSLKHKYFRSNDLDASVAYTFPDIRARLLVILEQGNVASVDRKPECLPVDLLELANAEVKINNREIGLIFDQTNFTCEYGGLCSDKGFVIVDEKLRFKVNSTRKRKGYIIHNVQLIGDKFEEDIKLRTGVQVTLQIDPVFRLNIMQNNTLILLMIAAVRKMFPVAYLKKGDVSEEYATLKMHVLGKEINIDACVKEIQEAVHNFIRKKSSVEVMIVPSSLQLLKIPSVLMHPELVYPHKNIRVISVLGPDDEFVREACNNVHVSNVADVGDFHITNVHEIKFKYLSITGITGENVEAALKLEKWIQAQADALKKEEEAVFNDLITVNEAFSLARKCFPILYSVREKYSRKPYLFTYNASECKQRISQLSKVVESKLRHLPRESKVRFLRKELEEQAKQDKVAIYLSTYNLPEFVHNSFVIDIVYRNQFPSLFFSLYRKKLNCVSHVPKCFISEGFNAEIWLKLLLSSIHLPLIIQDDVENGIFCCTDYTPVEPIEVLKLFDSLTLLGKHIAVGRMENSDQYKNM